jgi:hypothetical protein
MAAVMTTLGAWVAWRVVQLQLGSREQDALDPARVTGAAPAGSG